MRDYLGGPLATPGPCPPPGPTPTDPEAAELTRWVEWLEKTDWIERYAYFCPRCVYGSSFWPDNYTFTHLMYPEGCAYRNAGQVGRYSVAMAMQGNPGQAMLTFDTFGGQQRFSVQATFTPMANAIWDLRNLWNTPAPPPPGTPQHDYGGYGLLSLSLQLPPDATPASGYFAAGTIHLVNGGSGTADNPYQFSTYSMLSPNAETVLIYPQIGNVWTNIPGTTSFGYIANPGGGSYTVNVKYYRNPLWPEPSPIRTETISLGPYQALPVPRYVALPPLFDGWAEASIVFSPDSETDPWPGLIGASALYRHNATPAATPPAGDYELSAIPAVAPSYVVYLPRVRVGANINTTIRLVNISDAFVAIATDLYEKNNSTGRPDCSFAPMVGPRRILEWSPSGYCPPGDYSGRVYTPYDQRRIAAVVNESHTGSSDYGSYVGLPDVGNPTYSALVFRDHSGWFSTLHIANFHPGPDANVCQIAFYSNSMATPPPTPTPKSLTYGQSWIIDISNSSEVPELPPGFFGTAVIQCTWGEYAVVVAQTGPSQVGDRFGMVEAMAQRPTATPTPTSTSSSSSDWTFSGDVMDQTTGEQVVGTTVTLYRLVGTNWQLVDSTTTGPGGRFKLRASGGPENAIFRIVRQDPPGYTPVELEGNPFFASANSQEIVATSGLARGHYMNLHFLSRSEPSGTATPWATVTPTVTLTPTWAATPTATP